MPDSDWSSNDERNELTKKRQHKKSKHIMIEKDRKRRHSNSVERKDMERSGQKKGKTRKESDDNKKEDFDEKLHKNKSKYKNLETQDFSYVKRKKSENKYPSVDSEPENDDRKTQSKLEKRQDDRKSKSNRYSNKDEFTKDSHENSTMESEHNKSKSKSNKTNYKDTQKSNLKKKSNNYDSPSDSDHEERKLSGSSNKQKATDDNFKKPSSKKKKKYSKTFEEDQLLDYDQRSESYARITEDGSKDAGYYPERAISKGSREKNPNRNKYDDSGPYDRYEKGSLPLNEDDDDKYSGNSEKPYRYWSSSRGPVRKNSDSYWNKYSDRLKEPTEHVEVGPRYYGAGESLRREKSDNEGAKDKQKDDGTRDKEPPKEVVTPKQKKTIDLLTSKTGGAYIPPAKLRMMQESITDKSSAAYQRLAWEALKKSIQGHVNKVNTANIKAILKAVQKENIVRGRGLLCRALIQAQAASPSFTNVYASFVAVLNAKFPKIGELLLKRLVVQFRRGFKRNDKTICITAATFIAHLVNQEVAHEIIALEILTLLIETPTDDSVEVAIAFMKECGMKLTEVSSKGILGVFDLLRNILHEGKLEKRVQYMIEVMFQVRKENFNAHPSLVKELDLVDEEDGIQHMITLEENHDPEDILNVFKFDPDYEANEAKYKSLVELEDEEESGEEGSSGSGDSEDESDEDEEGGQKDGGVIVDKTETNLVALRKTIYLTIQSSLDFEECAHKLLRMELKPGQEIEMAHMFLDCCAEQRTYEKFYGLLAQRFCQINRSYVGPFEETFRDSYATIHRMSNDKLRNVGKLFAHLLYTDAISWEVLATIRLNEDDTTSSSRIFIKILFLELSEYMGLAKLNQRVKDPSLQVALEGLFPRDNPKHTRFAINFFTSIGLGGLTDELREHLKAQPKQSIVVPQLVEGLSSSSSSDSSSDSSDSSDSSSDSSSSESSSSESEDSSRKKKKKSSSKKKKQPAKKIEKEKSSKKRKNSPPKRKRDR